MTTPDQRPPTKPTDWVYTAITQTQCPNCQHNNATLIRPYHITHTGVERHPLHTRCWNCGHWEPTNL